MCHQGARVIKLNSGTVLNADVVGGASTTGGGNACTSSSSNGEDV